MKSGRLLDATHSCGERSTVNIQPWAFVVAQRPESFACGPGTCGANVLEVTPGWVPLGPIRCLHPDDPVTGEIHHAGLVERASSTSTV